MKKLLASDIDGTLIINGNIKNESIDHIKKFKDKGHAFILCTGRDFANTEHIFNEYDVDVDALVLCNGALILDKNLKEMKKNSIDADVVKGIYSEIQNDDLYNFAIVDGYKTYVVGEFELFDDFVYKVEALTEEEFLNKEHDVKLISINASDRNSESAEKLRNIINEKYKDYVIAYRNQYFIDIAPVGCSKAHGISQLIDMFEVVDDDVFVIGDSWNDLSMFESYKNSYTFNHAEDELKKYTKMVISEFHNCLEDILNEE
jgi:Cof subfamily protein (haloacid dehalogenase superfamily)